MQEIMVIRWETQSKKLGAPCYKYIENRRKSIDSLFAYPEIIGTHMKTIENIEKHWALVISWIGFHKTFESDPLEKHRLGVVLMT